MVRLNEQSEVNSIRKCTGTLNTECGPKSSFARYQPLIAIKPDEIFVKHIHKIHKRIY